MPYGRHHHHPDEGEMVITFSSREYMLPRPGQPGFHQPMPSQLHAPNVQYPTPFHLGPIPGQSNQQGILPSPMTAIPFATHKFIQKSKPSKTKTKVSRPATKPKVTKPSITKKRPQSSRHLTPSLRAAIITLKVTDPSKSFKEIGEILSFPAGDSGDDDNVDDEDDNRDGNVNNIVERNSTVNQDTQTTTSTTQPLPFIPVTTTQSSSSNDNTTDPNLETSISTTNNTDTTTATTATVATTTTTPSNTNPNSAESKSKSKKRKPIPRNTVAGIFKRAVDRAGTDSDLYKLLSQTNRQAGSGRPKKDEVRVSTHQNGSGSNGGSGGASNGVKRKKNGRDSVSTPINTAAIVSPQDLAGHRQQQQQQQPFPWPTGMEDNGDVDGDGDGLDDMHELRDTGIGAFGRLAHTHARNHVDEDGGGYEDGDGEDDDDDHHHRGGHGEWESDRDIEAGHVNGVRNGTGNGMEGKNGG